MAPRKRQKGTSSSTAKSEQEYDMTKFVSFEVQKKYVKSSVKRGMIQERSLCYHGQCFKTSEIGNGRNW